jgi:hypothetical protein
MKMSDDISKLIDKGRILKERLEKEKFSIQEELKLVAQLGLIVEKLIKLYEEKEDVASPSKK